VERLQKLIAENNMQDKIELCGAFCMGNCVKGVCVTANEELFSLQPENVDTFFVNHVMKSFS
jgi:NADH:ubiquinone oxidoreductase subunit E